VGWVLDRLEKDGLAGNTAVLFFGDHGRPHVRAKQWLYDSGIRVPLLFRWPGRMKPGSTDDRLVSFIDFAPTSLTLAGIRPPKGMQGLTFLEDQVTKRDVIFAARDRCDETVDRIRCVRTERFKYIRNYHPDRPYLQRNNYKFLRYPVISLMPVLHGRGELTPEQSLFMADRRPAEELYDVVEDPYEVKNLASDPNSAARLAELRRRLEDWVKRTGDKGAVPESSQRVQEAIAQMDDWIQARMARRQLDPDITPTAYLQWWERELGLDGE
jgi:uncharacterized sulfatase